MGSKVLQTVEQWSRGKQATKEIATPSISPGPSSPKVKKMTPPNFCIEHWPKSVPPLIAKKETILSKPSHMRRSSMQKRCSGKKNAALDAMLRTADTLSLEHEQKI